LAAREESKKGTGGTHVLTEYFVSG
jgi:hypothetical protein